MRVLLTSSLSRSRPEPVVPLAKAFRERGHDAVVVTAPYDLSPSPSWLPERDGVLKSPFWSAELVVATAANVLDFARTWRPDVILRETNEYGGQIAAEVLGIPHALLDTAPFAPLEIPLLDELMDKVRARFGVGATEPVFTAGLTPALWHPAQHHFRVPVDRGAVASFGAHLPPGSRLPHVVAEALGGLPATAKVVVTDAGHSDVREALTAGVPMVAVPLFADQPRNAGRIQDLNAGVRVDVKGLTADVLAERIQHVLNTRTYHDAAENLAAKIADLEEFTNIPDHLVSAV
ncbi:nucleotide disphospho-sugar-binding domain-containing protein [Lentzea sp. NPDC034063]|uniref:glycosyltransferase n=1 Tax=unclassified Lentzea TaxID=2643253 RepID=UPI0033D561B1